MSEKVVYNILTPGGYLVERVSTETYEQAVEWAKNHYLVFRISLAECEEAETGSNRRVR